MITSEGATQKEGETADHTDGRVQTGSEFSNDGVKGWDKKTTEWN